MDLSYCIGLVQRDGWIILVVLILIGLGGVGLHIWWSSKLAFFNFSKADSTNKGNFKRLFYPLIPISLLSLSTPIVAVLISSEFRMCLEDPKIVPYLNRFWVYVLPVKGTGPAISALVCVLLGVIVYWIFGFVLKLISPIMERGGG